MFLSPEMGSLRAAGWRVDFRSLVVGMFTLRRQLHVHAELSDRQLNVQTWNCAPERSRLEVKMGAISVTKGLKVTGLDEVTEGESVNRKEKRLCEWNAGFSSI